MSRPYLISTYFILDDQGTSGQSVTLALMSASGYIYTQTMDDASHAKHGPFYITTIVDIQHPDITVCNVVFV